MGYRPPRDWPIEWKVLYTVLYAGALAGLFFAGLVIALKIGHTPRALLDYYRGNPEAFRYAKTSLQLAEVSHFHAMIAPLLFAVLAWPLPLTPFSPRLRWTALGLGVLGIVLLLLDPWVLRYGPTFLVYGKYLGGVSLVAGVGLTGALVVASFFHAPP